MAGQPHFGDISERDFSTLLRALSGTPKGRAFLAEYLRRSRPEETGRLFGSLQRIEARVAAIGAELQPRRLAEELRRIAMTLEIAIDGASIDPEGDEAARRIALVDRSRAELAALAGGLAGEATPTSVVAHGGAADGAAFDPAGPKEAGDGRPGHVPADGPGSAAR
jgi:hypothetical protein